MKLTQENTAVETSNCNLDQTQVSNGAGVPISALNSPYRASIPSTVAEWNSKYHDQVYEGSIEWAYRQGDVKPKLAISERNVLSYAMMTSSTL